MIILASTVQAQFTIDAEIRPRFEANHGFRTLPVESSQTAYFVSQRTRLNLKYNTDKFTTYISLQDVRLGVGRLPGLIKLDSIPVVSGLMYHRLGSIGNLLKIGD